MADRTAQKVHPPWSHKKRANVARVLLGGRGGRTSRAMLDRACSLCVGRLGLALAGRSDSERAVDRVRTCAGACCDTIAASSDPSDDCGVAASAATSTGRCDGTLERAAAARDELSVRCDGGPALAGRWRLDGLTLLLRPRFCAHRSGGGGASFFLRFAVVVPTTHTHGGNPVSPAPSGAGSTQSQHGAVRRATHRTTEEARVPQPAGVAPPLGFVSASGRSPSPAASPGARRSSPLQTLDGCGPCRSPWKTVERTCLRSVSTSDSGCHANRDFI
jgi:hypothetical protein